MREFNIIGMHCANCSNTVERTVKKLPGITECNVNLLTNSMQVSGNASDKEIMDAVKEAGFDITLSSNNEDDSKKKLIK